MENIQSNRDLLLLLKNGDRVAFYNIYQRYCKRLYGFVLRYIKQEADADEIVQEVFFRFWESRERIDVSASIESYLFTIAYNTTISLFRKRATEQKYLDHLKHIQQDQKYPDILDELNCKELNERLHALLNELTPRQKEIFQLSRDQGLSHIEIADTLGISVNTVKKHMSTTLLYLKSSMGKRLVYSAFGAFLILL